LAGSQRLRRAFLATPVVHADRGQRLALQDRAEPQVLLIRSGFACRTRVLADNHRAILDVLIVGDIVGLDHIVVAHPVDEFIAASRVGYCALAGSEVRRLMADTGIALRVVALLTEARGRASQLAVALGRLDAEARICLFLLDVYDRLRRRDLVGQGSFNLPLTQEQIADHLGLTVVHVNRTLRRLREQRILLFDRQVVILLDVGKMRELSLGMATTSLALEGEREDSQEYERMQDFER
jgi:CRP-like cAMP-binding protein